MSAVTEELAEDVLGGRSKDAAEPPKPDETGVAMGFWHMGAPRPAPQRARDHGATWADIRRNYTAPVAAALDGVMDVTARRRASGRLLLLHGPPGTGKTTALRALARAWRDWCQFDCVLDPEALFGSPAT